MEVYARSAGDRLWIVHSAAEPLFEGALAGRVAELYPNAHVEQISGVPAQDIRMLGDLFGNPKLRITSLWCMGMNQHTRGTAINNLVHGLHLLSGHFGKPGDAPTSLTGQPSACGTVREVAPRAIGRTNARRISR